MRVKLSLVLLLGPVLGVAQELPTGEGRDIVRKICIGCHDLDTATSRRQTLAGWKRTVEKMQERGAEGTDEQFESVINYLAKNFSPAAPKTPAPQPAGQDFFFLQMSDTQFGMFADDANFKQETVNFEQAIDAANRLHPAFVVVCGDLINKPADAAQAAEYLRIAAKLDPSIPLYSVAGNHDVGNQPTPESLAAYRARFGPDYYTFRHGDFEGLVLDSSLIQHPEKATEEAQKQDAWVEEELKRSAAGGVKRIAIFEHIPLFLSKADEPDQYFNIPNEPRARYLSLYGRYGIDWVFAGHYHRNAYGEAGSLHMITTGPVSKPLGPDPSGIRVVSVKGTTMSSQYYGLADIPKTVELK
jgi:predicted phosphodiesterase